MTEDKREKLEAEFHKATVQLRKCLASHQGGKKAEQKYSRAYQALVKVGETPQIRGKYR